MSSGMASMVVVLMDDPRADCMFPGLERGESGEGWGGGWGWKEKWGKEV